MTTSLDDGGGTRFPGVMRLTLMVVVMGLASSCRHYRADPIAVMPGQNEGECIDRLLNMSRAAGYIEQTVDRQTNFFRVAAHAVPTSRRHAASQWSFNVQCDTQGALVTPVWARGVVSENDPIPKTVGQELKTFAARLNGY